MKPRHTRAYGRYESAADAWRDLEENVHPDVVAIRAGFASAAQMEAFTEGMRAVLSEMETGRAS